MDDLRWVLALVGALVVAAIYLSSRFERDDWQREREQRDSRIKPAPRQRKKEPRMTVPVPAAAGIASPTTDTAGSETIAPGADASASGHVRAPAIHAMAAEKSEGKSEPHFIADPAADAEGPAVAALQQPQPASGAREQPLPPAKDTVEQHSESGMTLGAMELLVDTAPAPTMDLDADVEDEIVDVEIPQDLNSAEEELQAAGEAEAGPLVEPEQASLPLGVDPLVLVVTVLAEDQQLFTGTDIEEALAAEGLRYGDMRIFHFFAAENNEPRMENQEAVFSLANLVEPGYFELENMAELETPGLSLFCQLPGPLPGNEALECMLDKARGLAVRLDGRMCDDKRNVFTAQARTHYQDRIAAFERELVLARKKQ